MKTDSHIDAYVESRMLGNEHVRFGGRRRGNHSRKTATGASPPTLWEPKGEKVVYAITLASEDIRAVFRRLLGHALHLIDAPDAKSPQVLRQAASVAEIASIVLNELPGGTREPQP